MSESLNEVILSTQPTFQKMDKANGYLLNFEQECMFARQQITKNQYSIDTAAKNSLSLKNAICNVAAIGISLNPAQAHAYLVPRDGQICLDVSYRGLVKLATDCGAIQWAKTELVYENDTFVWNGPNKAPDHKADPFSDRGDVKGGYCIARLPDGTDMIETMSRKEMDQIQETSKAKNGPWKHWPDEMRKKSVTKRASKSWPQTGDRKRIDTAIDVMNHHEGLVEEEKAEPTYTEAQENEYMRCVYDKDFFNLAGLITQLSADDQVALNNRCVPDAPRGQKQKAAKAFKEALEEGRMTLEAKTKEIHDLIEGGDDSAVWEIIECCSEFTREHILSKLDDRHVAAVNEIMEAA